eukprot:m.2702 g.2702  ORF g.2702 m.2702 type:complete len:887 (+) comp2572_c0_seq2:123-2783(+)
MSDDDDDFVLDAAECEAIDAAILSAESEEKGYMTRARKRKVDECSQRNVEGNVRKKVAQDEIETEDEFTEADLEVINDLEKKASSQCGESSEYHSCDTKDDRDVDALTCTPTQIQYPDTNPSDINHGDDDMLTPTQPQESTLDDSTPPTVRLDKESETLESADETTEDADDQDDHVQSQGSVNDSVSNFTATPTAQVTQISTRRVKLVHCHDHFVCLSATDVNWICDGCEKRFTTTSPSIGRYRCSQCDFDLCAPCTESSMKDVKISSAIAHDPVFQEVSKVSSRTKPTLHLQEHRCTLHLTNTSIKKREYFHNRNVVWCHFCQEAREDKIQYSCRHCQFYVCEECANEPEKTVAWPEVHQSGFTLKNYDRLTVGDFSMECFKSLWTLFPGPLSHSFTKAQIVQKLDMLSQQTQEALWIPTKSKPKSEFVDALEKALRTTSIDIDYRLQMLAPMRTGEKKVKAWYIAQAKFYGIPVDSKMKLEQVQRKLEIACIEGDLIEANIPAEVQNLKQRMQQEAESERNLAIENMKWERDNDAIVMREKWLLALAEKWDAEKMILNFGVDKFLKYWKSSDRMQNEKALVFQSKPHPNIEDCAEGLGLCCERAQTPIELCYFMPPVIVIARSSQAITNKLEEIKPTIDNLIAVAKDKKREHDEQVRLQEERQRKDEEKEKAAKQAQIDRRRRDAAAAQKPWDVRGMFRIKCAEVEEEGYSDCTLQINGDGKEGLMGCFDFGIIEGYMKFQLPAIKSTASKSKFKWGGCDVQSGRFDYGSDHIGELQFSQAGTELKGNIYGSWKDFHIEGILQYALSNPNSEVPAIRTMKEEYHKYSRGLYRSNSHYGYEEDGDEGEADENGSQDSKESDWNTPWEEHSQRDSKPDVFSSGGCL